MMEKDSPVKLSVAEMAGRFKGPAILMPTVQKETPSPVSPHAPKVQTSKCSPLIERLQANLALSSTSLLSSPKSPKVKLPPSPFCPTSPCSDQSPLSPQSPTLGSQPSSKAEEAIPFEMPVEGTTLPNFNKSRARLSFKRRPPTRQHRMSCGEEGVASGPGDVSPVDTDGPQENGAHDQVFTNPDEGQKAREGSQGNHPSPPAALTDTGDNGRDSKQAEESKAPGTTEEMEVDPINQDEEEEAGEQIQGEPQALDCLEAIEEEGSCCSVGKIDSIQNEEQEDPLSEEEHL
ncbi:capZ-interacting protein isoform X2 [Esox lucius]|uniref:FAM21/CAPZIP domain-containing protein n=1 Tax=Esox lucius TaxID=8010 RepID=A0AAY5L1Q7_ESOLU|nr:capZ-interacting protein isoform X2 [Esox lucius]